MISIRAESLTEFIQGTFVSQSCDQMSANGAQTSLTTTWIQWSDLNQNMRPY
jgi:hypothetical protein